MLEPNAKPFPSPRLPSSKLLVCMCANTRPGTRGKMQSRASSIFPACRWARELVCGAAVSRGHSDTTVL